MYKISLLFNTIRYLKLKQIVFQFWYRLKRIKPLINYRVTQTNNPYYHQSFSDFLSCIPCATEAGNFTFLNQKKIFNGKIDWDFMDNGKLWNYNLHYANYVLQEHISVQTRKTWLNDLHTHLNANAKGLEPYPVSLRLINTIRFICRYKLTDPELLLNVQAEGNFLFQRIEFHLLGNHLLENAFALLLVGAFFNTTAWVNAGQAILDEQLPEQVLDDGAHFELSPMYHQIILYRLLELIDWYSGWEYKNEKKLAYYIAIAKRMLSWLTHMTFSNGDMPLLNDSAHNITYTSAQLFDYAAHLNISTSNNIPLNSSGYRAYRNYNYECIVDAAQISVNYQPGHGHADALSFILYVAGCPVMVERGTSTYQIGEQRSLERSTKAHNTLVYKGKNQSQVWGGFRVASRAVVNISNDAASHLVASHDGYRKTGGIHQREFVFEDNLIIINDELITKSPISSNDIFVYFHMHPNIAVTIIDNGVKIGDNIKMEFTNAVSITKETYKFASQFNQYADGFLIKVGMISSLKTIIHIQQP